MGFGMKTLTGTSGEPSQVTYDGHPEWKSGSMTVDWSTVAAVSGSDLVLADEGYTVLIGSKVLVRGQIMCLITATGLFGPYDPAATGTGRETLTPGKCGILNMTLLEKGVLGITAGNPDNGNLIEGGRVWYSKIRQSVAATHTLALGPTFAELVAAMPRLQFSY